MAPRATRRSPSEGSRSPVRGAAGAFAFSCVVACAGGKPVAPTRAPAASASTTVVAIADPPAAAPPALEPPLRFLALPNAAPRTGCTVAGEGFDGLAELALDAGGVGTFGEARAARKTSLHFGDGTDAAVTAHLEIDGFSFDVFARSVHLYVTARTVYQAVYEPYATTLLDVRAASPTTLRIEPEAWKGKDAPVFDPDSPWTVPCARVGLVMASFEVPRAEKSLGDASPIQGSFELAPRPGAPAVVRLPHGAVVQVVRFEGAYAYVEWASDHGRYRGFVKRSNVELGAGLIGRGYGTGGARRGYTSCKTTSLLYVVHDAGTAHLVGSVLPGTPVTFLPLAESRPPALDDGKLTFVQPPWALKLRPGYRLAIATEPPGSCRARPVEPPPQ